MLSLLHHQIVNEASVTTSAFDARAAHYYATDPHKEHAPLPFYESSRRSTQHAITETATEASDLFGDEDGPMQCLDVHGLVSGELARRFYKFRGAPRGGFRHRPSR